MGRLRITTLCKDGVSDKTARNRGTWRQSHCGKTCLVSKIDKNRKAFCVTIFAQNIQSSRQVESF